MQLIRVYVQKNMNVLYSLQKSVACHLVERVAQYERSDTVPLPSRSTHEECLAREEQLVTEYRAAQYAFMCYL